MSDANTIDTVPRTAPGSLKSQVVISDDFDEFTEEDERDWYGE